MSLGYIYIENISDPKHDDEDIIIRVDRQNPILGNQHILANKLDMKARLKVIDDYSNDFYTDDKAELRRKEVEKIAELIKQGKTVCFQCHCSPFL